MTTASLALFEDRRLSASSGKASAFRARYASTSNSRRVSGTSSPVPPCPTSVEVDLQPLRAVRRYRSSWSGRGAPEQRLDARKQLRNTEWFARVVVCAAIARFDSVALAAPPRQHQDRHSVRDAAPISLTGVTAARRLALPALGAVERQGPG